MYSEILDTIGFVSRFDPEVGEAMQQELGRQQRNIELIASENFVSPAVMAAMGSVLTNKYAEGYPGKRYYGGCQYVDIVEKIAIERAKELFGAECANVQPHSGAQANMAVYFALIHPGDTVMGMNLAHGGHLTHGSPVNMSGKYFNFVPYGVNADGYIDYDAFAEEALKVKPKLIVAGASAYPRIIDFKRDKFDMSAKVLGIEYDPNRSAHIALIQYEDGEKRYILAPAGLKAGDTVEAGAGADIKPGNALPLANIPTGTFVHNVELYPGRGGQLARAAGNAAQLMAKEGAYALLRLPSGELRNVSVNCMATIGQVGNVDHENVKIGKAGRKRHMGWRPTVRGSVMNPNDHPHGGGEGKSPIGRPGPVTPWGKPALGYKTRAKKNRSDKMIVKRRNGK